MTDKFQYKFDIKKSNDDQQMVFGWANVAVRANGEQIEDFQKDIIDPEDLEKAAYDFVLNYGTAGEMHERSNVGTLVESMMFTKQKLQLLGIPEGTLPEGWWIGFKITDDCVWKKVKDGTYAMFSIEGSGYREEVS